MIAERQRVDLWLWRARFAKSRAGASRLVTEGGVRLVRDGAGRRLDKASATLTAGDVLVLPSPSGPRSVRIEALPRRRGSGAEARALYTELDADLAASLDGGSVPRHVSGAQN